MFDLVADVEEYPKFVPLCANLVVRSRSEDEGRIVLLADMTVAYAMFHETFTSRVTLDESKLQILVEYVDGPFRKLENRWRFRPVDETSCEIDFYIDWELRSRALAMVVGSVFDRAFRRFADAFESRADVVYRPA
jgi:coenzyme Q-binding protein COQ10